MSTLDFSDLAVDDDEISIDIVSDMLEQLGVSHIHTAKDGRPGLRAMAQMTPTPRFMIVDVFMPDMDGIEFLGKLAERQYAGGVE
jgi:CheY-like chemotaxis protein